MEGERFFDDLNETMLGNFSVAIRNSKWCTYGSLMAFGITVEVGNRSSMRLFVAMLRRESLKPLSVYRKSGAHKTAIVSPQFPSRHLFISVRGGR
jgi:hypothetical protein